MRRLSISVIAICVMFGFGATASVVMANSSDTSTTAKPTPIKIAKDLMRKDKYAEALVVLEKAVRAKPENADLLNVTGYAYRKIGVLKDALIYYNRALAVDPQHKGALNYLGMLYVSNDQMDEAKALLVRLDDACFFGCDELDTLKTAIETGVVQDTAAW